MSNSDYSGDVPAITGISISGTMVLAVTTDSPFHDTAIGDWSDVQRNLREWGAVCGADDAVVDGLLARLRRAGA